MWPELWRSQVTLCLAGNDSSQPFVFGEYLSRTTLAPVLGFPPLNAKNAYAAGRAFAKRPMEATEVWVFLRSAGKPVIIVGEEGTDELIMFRGVIRLHMGEGIEGHL